MNQIAIILSMVLLIAFTPVSANAASIATTTPIAKLIADGLLADTPIQVAYLPPRRLPYGRIGNWLQHKAALKEIAHYHSLLTVEALRPDLAAYPLLRRGNIAVIPIDITRQMTPGGTRISSYHGDSYFWLHPDNLQVMINIAAADLVRVWPQFRHQIIDNRQILRQQIRHYQLSIDELLLDAGIDEVSIHQAGLKSAAEATALPLQSADTETDPMLRRLTIRARKKSHVPAQTEFVWSIEPMVRLTDQTLSEALDFNIGSLKQALTHR
ncbi:hypothetical protein [Marinobacterium jannaschii]|uniref:hypothetical protein n=1 Tax=Marinobacterium jannaschii TaxID=64970 RepID=UPI00047F6094|nr:hypothetical protein [Marinobacterium jannaschii]